MDIFGNLGFDVMVSPNKSCYLGKLDRVCMWIQKEVRAEGVHWGEKSATFPRTHGGISI